MERSDADLLAAWHGGDNDAGNVLIERHFASVYRFLRRRLPERAEDLTQHTFLACAERKTPELTVGFRPYVLGIARNLLFMELRKRYRTPEASDDEISQLVLPSQASPSKFVARQQERELLLQAMHSLPVEQQLVLELHYWEHMSTGQIADVLGVPSGTVKWRLTQARKRLEQEIRGAEAPAELVHSTIVGLEEALSGAHESS